MRNLEDVYFVGGSPCSGKSTIVEMISNKNDFYYFKVDDFLEKYIKLAALDHKPICTKVSNMTSDEIWMRNPLIQSEEEFEIYNEMFEFIISDIKSIKTKKTVIAEGAAFTPEFAKKYALKKYIAIIPTKDFQLFHYQKRPWINEILKDCQDKEKAFNNWMERDSIFANAVYKQCIDNCYDVIINDGRKTIDQMLKQVEEYFKIGD